MTDTRRMNQSQFMLLIISRDPDKATEHFAKIERLRSLNKALVFVALLAAVAGIAFGYLLRMASE